MRAARADPRPALLGATEARPRLPTHGFAGTIGAGEE